MGGACQPATLHYISCSHQLEFVSAGPASSGTGHHHLLIDTDVPSDLSKSLPATDQIKHFGGGQTETEITLSPGKHTLQLLVGDHMHVPHNPPVVSEKITVMVE